MPYLSVVVGGRNDDYGGNFLGRMQNFLAGIDELAGRHRLDTELIVVDWNPPEDSAPLVDAVDWPATSRLRVRVVSVPADVHMQLPNSGSMPIFEYIAKNVGIRRATGEFVLATNPDLLYNDPLLRLLARRRLERDRYYRVDRYDVLPPLPRGNYRDKLGFCAYNFTKVNVSGGTIVFSEPPRGWRRSPLGVRLQVREHFRGRRESLDLRDPVRRLHTNASGDFLLMHRDRWHSLRGYPELYTASHIDGYMCAIAASSGLRETALPYRYRIYHQEHPRAVDFGDLKASIRPLTSYDEYASAARRMFERSAPEGRNGEGWGLGAETLVETVPDQLSTSCGA